MQLLRLMGTKLVPLKVGILEIMWLPDWLALCLLKHEDTKLRGVDLNNFTKCQRLCFVR